MATNTSTKAPYQILESFHAAQRIAPNTCYRAQEIQKGCGFATIAVHPEVEKQEYDDNADPRR